MLHATVSGSFHRHISDIYFAVSQLRAAGVNVLSPVDPTIVDQNGDFLFVASDILRSVKLVQDRHFEAIRASDFLWLICPDGYTGSSASAEIGAAHICGTPVFSNSVPSDATLKHYVCKVTSTDEAVSKMRKAGVKRRQSHFLLDPVYAVDVSISALDEVRSAFRS